MTTPMHLCGIKTPFPEFSVGPLNFQALRLKHVIHLEPYVASSSGSSRTCCHSDWIRSWKVSCHGGHMHLPQRSDTRNQGSDGFPGELTCVMKFGGSSVASGKRMKEVADLVLSFPNERPVIVLPAIGKTTNMLLMVFVIKYFVIYIIKLWAVEVSECYIYDSVN